MRYFVAILLTLLGYQSTCQQVVWTRIHAVTNNYDVLYSITSLDSNGYYAVGGGQLYTVSVFGSPLDGSHIAKIGSDGRLLWTRPLNFAGYSKGIIKLDERTLAVVTDVLDFNNIPDRGGFVLQIVDSTGSIIRTTVVKELGYSTQPYGMFKAKNGDLIVYGVSGRGRVYPNTNLDWFLARFTPQGYLDWLKVYNPGSTDPNKFAAFNDSDGKIILGGSVANRLVRMVVDSNGVIVDSTRNLFVPTAGGPNFNFVQRCPDGGLIVQTSPRPSLSTSPTLNIVKLRQDNSQEWLISHPSSNSIIPIRIMTDGSFIVVRLDWVSNTYLMTKYDAQSNVLWEIPIANLPSSISNLWLYGITYNPDQSAVLCGFVSNGTRVPSTGQDFYFTKIANFGRPFDPLTELGGPREVALSFAPVAFPNPTSGQVQFRGLDRPGQLRLFTTAGSLALDAPILPDQALDLTGLAPGLYLYRLTVADGKVPFVGRVVVR
jgi:hypothetical protein